MKKKLVATSAVLAVLGAFAALVGASATAAPTASAKSEHWGVITRNTIGSPVGDLRTGPYGSFGVTGDAAKPPYGKGSLGIETAAVPGFVEKVDFGNEVDFFGDPVLEIDQTGFHVFQTGENASINPRNMPNIKMEIDANLNSLPADNYTTMVWVPDAAPVVNQWSGYIDATTTGNWFFTGAEGAATGCTDALTCDFEAAMTALDDGPPSAEPVIYTVAVAKGRDYNWAGAVDGFRINRKVYDFESEPKGVHERGAGPLG